MFVEGMALRISCSCERSAEMRVTPSGANVTSLRVSCTGRWGRKFFELTAWNESAKDEGGKADKLNEIQAVGTRLIAIGIPREEIYQPVDKDGKPRGVPRIQNKLTVSELWAEFDGELKELIGKCGILEEEVERVPLAVPAEVRF